MTDSLTEIPAELRLVRGSLSTSTRRETFQGRPFLVVPITALVEGVTNGALSLMSEFANLKGATSDPAALWNGRPIVVVFKSEDGHGADMNTPEHFEKRVVGHIFNAKLTKDRLRFEGWIDLERAKAVGEAGIESIRQITDKTGDPLEVSVGFWTKPEQTSGEFEGKGFSEIERDIRPNHLALLPFAEGACNAGDGCGVRDRVKKESKAMDETKLAEFIGKITGAISTGFANLLKKEGDAMTKTERIAALIADESNSWAKEDFATLEGFTEDALAKMAPCECVDGKGKSEDEKKGNSKPATEDGAQASAKATDGGAGDDRYAQLEQKVADLTGIMAGQTALLSEFTEKTNAEREGLVKGLIERSKVPMEKSVLEAMSVTALRQLAKLVGLDRASYIGAGGGIAAKGDDGEVRNGSGARVVSVYSGWSRIDAEARAKAEAKESEAS